MEAHLQWFHILFYQRLLNHDTKKRKFRPDARFSTASTRELPQARREHAQYMLTLNIIEKVLTLLLQQHRKKVAITSSKVWKNWISYLFQHCGYGIYKPKKTNRIVNKISNITNTQPHPRVIFFKKTAFFLKQKDALGTRLPHLQRNFTKKIRRPLIIVKGCTEYEVETYC